MGNNTLGRAVVTSRKSRHISDMSDEQALHGKFLTFEAKKIRGRERVGTGMGNRTETLAEEVIDVRDTSLALGMLAPSERSGRADVPLVSGLRHRDALRGDFAVVLELPLNGLRRQRIAVRGGAGDKL